MLYESIFYFIRSCTYFLHWYLKLYQHRLESLCAVYGREDTSKTFSDTCHTRTIPTYRKEVDYLKNNLTSYFT